MILIRNEIITFRVSADDKTAMINEAKKRDMKLSEFINRAINESISIDHLTESQEQFAETFEIIFKKVYEPYSKRDLAIMNRLNYNIKWMLRIFNLMLKHIKIPQDKDTILTSFADHPILDIANDEVIKEIRNNKIKKDTTENEYE